MASGVLQEVTLIVIVPKDPHSIEQWHQMEVRVDKSTATVLYENVHSHLGLALWGGGGDGGLFVCIEVECGEGPLKLKYQSFSGLTRFAKPML